MYTISQAPSAANLTVTGAASTTAVNAGIFNVIAGEPGAGSQLALNAPGSNRLNGQPFRVRAAGYSSIAAGTFTTSIQTLLYGSTTAGFTAAAASAIYSVAAIAVTVSSASATVIPWCVEALISGDSTSGKVVGSITGLLNNGAQQGATAPVAIVNAPTSINFATEPPLQFAMGVSVGTTANTFPLTNVTHTLTEMQLEA